MATGGLLQPVVVGGLEGWGWRTMAFVSGCIILVVGVPLAGLVRHKPDEMGLRADGDPPREKVSVDWQRRARGRPRRGVQLHGARGDAHALVLAALGSGTRPA